MGETVDYMGKPQKRIAPLDFLAVTDHAEYLGVVRDSIDPNGPFGKTEWYTMMTSTDPAVSGHGFQEAHRFHGRQQAFARILRSQNCCAPHGRNTPRFPTSTTQPGKFTTFVGFEWTSAPRFPEPAPLRDLRR